MKKATYADEDVSEKKGNHSSKYQDWMEVNRINKGKSLNKHENTSNSRELFYFNQLLNQVKGPSSYTDIRTVKGVLYPTYEEAYNFLFI